MYRPFSFGQVPTIGPRPLDLVPPDPGELPPAADTEAPSMERPGSVQVAVVDGHEQARRGCMSQLQDIPAVRVVLQACHGLDFLEQLPAAPHIHIVLVEMMMPRMDGAQLMAQLRAERPEMRLLATGSSQEDELLLRAVRAGAHGFYHKGGQVQDIERALDHLLRTGYYHTDRLHALLLEHPGGITPEIREARRLKQEITGQEMRIMSLLVDSTGHTTKSIGALLYLSARTVDNHIHSVCRKMGCPNRLIAAVKLERLGFFGSRGPVLD